MESVLEDEYCTVCSYFNGRKCGLKVVGNEKSGGVRKQATVRIGNRTMAIDVCLLFNVAIVFCATCFRFLFVKLY
jgi:hypothetical protein